MRSGGDGGARAAIRAGGRSVGRGGIIFARAEFVMDHSRDSACLLACMPACFSGVGVGGLFWDFSTVLLLLVLVFLFLSLLFLRSSRLAGKRREGDFLHYGR